jgi:hypothetical protein
MNNPETPTDHVELALFRWAKLRHGDSADSPFDWDRFYRFVVSAHACRRGWDAHDVKARLLQYGLPQTKATEMAEVYWHCRCVLRVRSKWADRFGYANWIRSGGVRLT